MVKEISVVWVIGLKVAGVTAKPVISTAGVAGAAGVAGVLGIVIFNAGGSSPAANAEFATIIAPANMSKDIIPAIFCICLIMMDVHTEISYNYNIFQSVFQHAIW